MRQIALYSVVIGLCLTVNSQLMAQGVWTAVSDNPTGISTGTILLSDGTVIVTASNTQFADTSWTKLTPDASGNYVNGTWSSIASMITARRYFSSNVLPSGKVFVIGGEYSGPIMNRNYTNLGEIYDPVANKWTAIATFPRSQFGDDPTVVLSTGKILCGFIGDGTFVGNPQTFLYDPVFNSWSRTGNKLRGDQSDEETWALLPDGSILSYDVFASPATGAGSAQRYIPSSGTWVTTGPVPVPLTNGIPAGTPGGLGSELGPMLLLPDGRVFLIGANNNTVLYTPSTDTWAQGPSIPGVGMGSDDAPAAILPNGHVIFLADTSLPINFTAPTKVFDFDPVAMQITDVTPGGTLGAILANSAAFTYGLLVLPNGHLLLSTGEAVFSNGLSTLWDYAPTGTPNAAWAPTITSITKGTGSTYTLKGTQLNGLSEGSSYGDDLENATNYPLVRLKSLAGIVKYARTTNWAPGVVASGTKQVGVDFTLPAGLGIGVYQLAVVANGIPSTSQSFVVGPAANPSNVIATYNATTRTLSLTGDASDNSFTVSLQAGVITVEGANGTKINNNTEFKTPTAGPLTIVAHLNGGNDAMSIIGVNSSSTTVDLGAGTNKLAVTLSHFTTLTVTGGSGVDSLLTTSSTIGTLYKTSVP